MADNFLYLTKDINLKSQEAQQILTKKLKKSVPGCNIIKLLKTKGGKKALKAAREKMMHSTQ